MSHTYAVLEISEAAYREIQEKLTVAGYQHAFHDDVIDMHGIAVKSVGERQHEWQFYMNGTFCRRCGVVIGTAGACR